MWESIRLSAVGNFLFHKLAVVIVAVVMSALFVATTNSPTTYAADATWSGDTITYNGDTYNKQALTLPNTDPNSQIFVSTPTNTDPNSQTKTAKVIVIPSGADTTKDVNNATETDYTVDANGNYTNPVGQKTIAVGAQTNAGANNGDSNQNKTSCAVTGVGWIVCATSRFMAQSMDKIYSWISDFLTVKPLTTDTSSPLFQAWAIMRGIANACFIVAFLIIIYSQITSYGISNYEIKKMIPRLIIAAILVNVSYYICAIGVDLSNIMGDSVAKALSQIRDSLPAPNPQGDFFNSGGAWSRMATYVLSGGTIGTIGMVALTSSAAGGSVAALATLLFPVLIMAVLSVLVALIILAGRQALITVLVVLSPLAFVLFLLPNTQKHFERWRGLFVTMLMVFPMFSLLFGGSQLASYLIIQNTDQIHVVILALFVQAAPLALTPFLLQFSGSLLGRIAGMVNNPQKGLVDRSRNWAKDRADTLAKRKMAQNEGGNWLRKPTPGRIAYRRAASKRNRDDRKKLYESQLDAAWSADDRSRELSKNMKISELRQNASKATVERMYEHAKETTPALMNLAGIQRLEEARVKQMHAAEDAKWEEAKTGKLADGHAFTQFSPAAHTVYRETRIAESQAAIAQALQKRDFANEVSEKNPSVEVALVQQRAGGTVDPRGKVRVQASAMSEVVKAGKEDVEAIKLASPIEPGDIKSMRAEFDKAVIEGDVASLRAHADMLGSSKNAGIMELRSAIDANEAKMRENKDLLDTFRHHINSNGEINQAAEDIGVWSRDANFDEEPGGKQAWRTRKEIAADAGTWQNMTSSSFSSMKASSQEIALTIKDADGNWAISREIATDILRSPVSRANLKEKIKPLIDARAKDELNWDGSKFRYPGQQEGGVIFDRDAPDQMDFGPDLDE